MAVYQRYLDSVAFINEESIRHHSIIKSYYGSAGINCYAYCAVNTHPKVLEVITSSKNMATLSTVAFIKIGQTKNTPFLRTTFYALYFVYIVGHLDRFMVRYLKGDFP